MIEKAKNVVLVILVVAVCWLGYEHFHKEPVPEIVNVPQVTRQEVQKAMPDMSRKEVERTTKVIERTTTKEAPAQSWYAVSEPAADTKAQEIAKEQKADKVIKHTEEKQVEGSDNKVVAANYYGINLERKHRVKAGVAIINNEPYGIIAYQNRDIEYTAYAGHDNYGAGIQYTIAKW